MPKRKRNTSNLDEFHHYGKYRKIVEKLVDDDEEETVRKFYESLSNDDFPVKYITDFTKAIDEIVKPEHEGTPMVIVTRIALAGGKRTAELRKIREDEAKNNKQPTIDSITGYHAISIFKNAFSSRSNKIEVYLFDPNGNFDTRRPRFSYYRNPYDKEHYLLDRTDGGYAGLNRVIQENVNKEIEITFPKFLGIQQYCENYKGKGYINECGYCMFMNYLVIKNVVEHFTNSNTSNTRDKVVLYVSQNTDINQNQAETKLQNIFGNVDDDKDDKDDKDSNKCIGKRFGDVVKEIFKSDLTGSGLTTYERCKKCGKQKNPYMH